MDFVFVSLQRINTGRESTSTSLAKELAKHHNVLYVNPPIDRKAWLFGSNDSSIQSQLKLIRSKNVGLYKETNSLWILNPVRIIESLNWIPSTRVFSFFNYFNNKRFGGEICDALEKIGFNEYVLIIDKDIFRSYYLKEILAPKYSIYLDRDYTLGFDYWKRHGTSLEPKLMKKCDAVVCNSIDFAKRAKKYNPNSHYISNGADLDNFDPDKVLKEPLELRSLERPIIGYVGALVASRLNIDLITYLATNIQKGSIVLIGPQDKSFLNSDLHQKQNIHFVSPKHTKQIPAYIKHFDVCINPQLLNEITMGNFPLKIVEYLAMGRPVVATATNTMGEVFKEHCYLSSNQNEFIEKINQALVENSNVLETKRVAFSKKFSWEKIASNLLEVIKTLEP